MKEEIKIGEYVRTKTGYIDKVDALCGMIEDTVHLEKAKWTDMKNIAKHSPNIIDLIEVGDYVNGSRILDVYEKDNEIGIRILDFGYRMAIFDEELKTIVTHEQFESVSYEVEQ